MSAMTPLNDAAVAAHAERVKRDGFTIVENAIEPELIDALKAALARLERELDAKPAMNGFEGHKTVRIYNLLNYGDPFTRVPVHASVLPVVEISALTLGTSNLYINGRGTDFTATISNTGPALTGVSLRSGLGEVAKYALMPEQTPPSTLSSGLRKKRLCPPS
jgi:hypothetical protein